MAKLTSWIPRLWSNWLSLTGAVLVTISGLAMLLAMVVLQLTNVYLSAFVFLVLPAVFVIGLLMIPVGMWLERRRARRNEAAGANEASLRAAFGELLQRPVVKRRLALVAGLSFLNLFILALAGHEAVVLMETPEFCGTVCHDVMQPEYEAYLRSPHSRVACVECHIGPGASWAVRSKIDGLRQVWGVITDDYTRPIPSPVHELRPARDTCEHCHWPTKFHGNRVTFRRHREKDEENTLTITALAMKIGGENPSTGKHEGIHWHVSPDISVRYEAFDEKREKIGRITVLRGEQIVAEYLPPEGVAGAVMESRTMDCVDCHNRPTHVYDGSPADALDAGFDEGLLDASTPNLKKLALPILAREDRLHEGAEALMRAELELAYRQAAGELPASDKLDAAARGLATLFRRNVYPTMAVGWDTYPTHLGHRGDDADKRGCFRCHDDEHQTADGKTLSQDCDLCHVMLAEEEPIDELSDSLKSLLTGK